MLSISFLSFHLLTYHEQDGLKHTQTLEDADARHDHLKSIVTAKQAQFSKPTEIAETKSILDLAFRLFLVELLVSTPLTLNN